MHCASLACRKARYKEVLVSALQKLTVESTMSIMNDKFVSNERAGLCEDASSLRIKGMFNCNKLVGSEFVMLPNCDVVLCCMDFGLKHNLGNLLTETYDQICTGKPYRAIKANRFKRDGDVICRNCTMAKGMVKFQAIRAARKVATVTAKRMPAALPPDIVRLFNEE